MKARAVKLVEGEGYVDCIKGEATHVTINFPSHVGVLTLPVIIKGTRAGTGCWTWNGDLDKPTLRPSVLTTNNAGLRCHSWVNNGQAQFLSDCSHDLAGKTVDLLDVT